MSLSFTFNGDESTAPTGDTSADRHAFSHATDLTLRLLRMHVGPVYMNRFRALAVAAALMLLPVAAAAQADTTSTLQVVIHAQEGGGPVAGANVELLGRARAQNADSTGTVRFRNIPPGPLIVQIRKLGYGEERFPVQVSARDSLTIEVDLETAAVRLAEVRATARFSSSLRNTGFFERRASGIGSYASREDWQRRGRLEVSDVIRRMRGARVVRTSDGRNILIPTRALASIGGGCATMQVYVDGVMLAFDPSSDDIDKLVNLSEVEGVEVYAGGSETPAQYNATGSSCGVVLIWRTTAPR